MFDLQHFASDCDFRVTIRFPLLLQPQLKKITLQYVSFTVQYSSGID